MRGMHTHRLASNPKEKAFAEAWDDANENETLLAYLLSINNRVSDTTMTERDQLVAATVIQWLGSLCGQYFLRQAYMKEAEQLKKGRANK